MVGIGVKIVFWIMINLLINVNMIGMVIRGLYGWVNCGFLYLRIIVFIIVRKKNVYFFNLLKVSNVLKFLSKMYSEERIVDMMMVLIGVFDVVLCFFGLNLMCLIMLSGLGN